MSAWKDYINTISSQFPVPDDLQPALYNQFEELEIQTLKRFLPDVTQKFFSLTLDPLYVFCI